MFCLILLFKLLNIIKKNIKIYTFLNWAFFFHYPNIIIVIITVPLYIYIILYYRGKLARGNTVMFTGTRFYDILDYILYYNILYYYNEHFVRKE